MKRFILVTFLFLVWGFWELSGGTDFTPMERESVATGPDADPQQAQTAAAGEATGTSASAETDTSAPAAEAAEPAQAAEPVQAQAADTAPEPTSAEPSEAAPGTATDDLAAQVAAALNQAQDQIDQAEAQLAPAETAPIETAPAADPAAAPAEATQAEQPATEATEVAAQPAPDRPNLQVVDATRVNMRSGPSTDYRVLDQLLQGTTVDVLENGPDGWVRLRVVDTGIEGWMSGEFLTGQ